MLIVLEAVHGASSGPGPPQLVTVSVNVPAAPPAEIEATNCFTDAGAARLTLGAATRVAIKSKAPATKKSLPRFESMVGLSTDMFFSSDRGRETLGRMADIRYRPFDRPGPNGPSMVRERTRNDRIQPQPAPGVLLQPRFRPRHDFAPIPYALFPSRPTGAGKSGRRTI